MHIITDMCLFMGDLQPLDYGIIITSFLFVVLSFALFLLLFLQIFRGKLNSNLFLRELILFLFFQNTHLQ